MAASSRVNGADISQDLSQLNGAEATPPMDAPGGHSRVSSSCLCLRQVGTSSCFQLTPSVYVYVRMQRGQEIGKLVKTAVFLISEGARSTLKEVRLPNPEISCFPATLNLSSLMLFLLLAPPHGKR